ncbi:MAG: efflux RND transporter periplasmic adaptor subunit [Gammaproteobacteria bacterium]|nr:efflux RND transporter periplasmic adaptor subunit [Gammaproteobacteria bacterium]
MIKTMCIGLLIILNLLCNVPVFSAKDNTIPVTVKPLEQLVFHPVKKAPAQVVTLQNSLLSSEISALVDKIYVQIGERVEKYQLLISLECDDYELNYQQIISEKNVLLAERQFTDYQFERSKKLIKSNSVSKEAHKRLSTKVAKNSAQIQLLNNKLKQSEKNISRCQIKAPFSGVIAERLVHLGEHVSPHTPLARLIDTENLEVEVQVPIVLIDNIDYSSLNFIYRNKQYPLKIRAIIPSIETRARHQKVRLSFLSEKTLPDAYGIVEITLRAMHIPANYLVSRNSQTGIFLLKKLNNTENHINEAEEGLFKAQFYPIDNALTGRAAIIDLPLNTEVIISGRNALSDGQHVSLKKIDSKEK